ncbi:MAG: hypothetical protein ACOCZ8_05725, partial [Bacteroidota bacterium]
MRLYVPTDPRVEVSGQLIVDYINAISFGHDTRREIFENNGIFSPNSDSWHAWDKVLNAIREIENGIGKKMLFLLSSSMIKNLSTPKPITSISDSFQALEDYLNDTHRGGNFGHFKVDELNESEQFALLNVWSPYPDVKIDGYITGALRKTGPVP